MTAPYPYGTPPPWWGRGREAAGEAARLAIVESERLRLAGKLKPIAPRAATFEGGLFGEMDDDNV